VESEEKRDFKVTVLRKPNFLQVPTRYRSYLVTPGKFICTPIPNFRGSMLNAEFFMKYF
jgi:hypothetical protein